MKLLSIKTAFLATFSAAGAVLASFFGGVDTAFIVLVSFLCLDFVSGLIVALVFKKSVKTAGGAADSRVCVRGLFKKVAVLFCVGMCAMLDRIMGTPGICRMGGIFFFIGNEGLSVCENIGLMGVPLPKFIKNALEVLREKGDNDKNG